MTSKLPLCGMTARQFLRTVTASASRYPCMTCLSMYTSAPAGTDWVRSAAISSHREERSSSAKRDLAASRLASRSTSMPRRWELKPDPPRGVSLLLRSLFIGHQNHIDELDHRPQTRLAANRWLALRRHRTRQGLPHRPPMNSQLPRCSLDRPRPVCVLPSDLLE